ncbi:MAG: nuclear transport factor 2 family protein [Saprospiraceae bacterium]|nr:nuclear transport factor 2 family protein [Saprospiraceae bacterium]
MLKSIAMILLFSSTLISLTNISKQDKEKITTVVTQFAKYADTQDATAMGTILDDQYRAYLNRLMGSNAVSTIDKATYLQLLTDKKIGGEERTVAISSLDINGNNAFVKVSMKGQKLAFVSYLLLAKTESGEWKIVADMPAIK